VDLAQVRGISREPARFALAGIVHKYGNTKGDAAPRDHRREVTVPAGRHEKLE